MIELSIVSGTYNRLPYLKKMIDSVRASIGGLSYQIVLCDGGSTDGTLEWIRAQPDIKLVEHRKLLGAIKAYNDACAVATGHYVVLANDDLYYVGDSIRRAVDFMTSRPDVGIGCFYTERAGRASQVAQMPAHHANGQMTSVPYGGLIIIPRWLGDKLKWWTLPKARTYGGDNVLVARSFEAGWPVVPLPGCRIVETIPHDKLNTINNPPTNDDHPDTQAYLKLYPHGPELGHARQFEAPSRPRRILYAPVYEKGHAVQHQQKRGLRRALQRIGLVREVDYVTFGANSILEEAKAFQPDLVITQLHGPDPFTISHAIQLRQILPTAKLVNWCGDVTNLANHVKYGHDYCAMLTHFDLHTTVNVSAVYDFMEKGVNTAFWEIGYEPDGVGSPANTANSDIVFLGSGYSKQRQDFGQFLHALPYKTALYGTSWPGIALADTTYDFIRGKHIINSAKIVLGDGQYPDAYGFVSNRLFQSLAAGGAMLLHQEFPGMAEMLGFIDGTHLVTWRDLADLKDKLAYYLDPAHEAERAEIARAGQLECLRNHSFEVRVKRLLELLSHKEIPPHERHPEYANFHEARRV